MPHRPPLVIGHRGASGHRPEHSRSAYALALAAGVDAVEPDVVPSRDGVLVVRHENELSGTTDVSARPEFAGRRATKTVDGHVVTGWFTEDFTWAELATLRCRERIPAIRPGNAVFDDTEPLLRLEDVLALVDEASREAGRALAVVVEIKHARHFAALGLDPVPLVHETLVRAGWGGRGLSTVIESFEPTALLRLRERGLDARYVYLLDDGGEPADAEEARAEGMPGYAEALTDRGLARLQGRVDGVSPAKSLLLREEDGGARTRVEEAHRHGLDVFTWTCRPENLFLDPRFRTAGGAAEHGDHRAEWALLRDAGVDGVFVDHPDLGVAAFRG